MIVREAGYNGSSFYFIFACDYALIDNCMETYLF